MHLLLELSLEELAARLRRRTSSPVELAQAVLDRIAARNPDLNAFTTLVPAHAVLDAARAAEAEIARDGWRGPLHGVPIGVKDLFDTAGLRTTYGSGMFRDHVPARDAAVVERLRAAGAVLTGKTATHELGAGITTDNFFFGPTRNPWNRLHVPGGSSGGAAAATAAGLGPVQLASDGGGSIRIPATFCGVVGYKPTLGALSNRGQFGDGNTSFSVPGPIARSVRDAALMAQTLAGFDLDYVFSRPEPLADLLATIEDGVRGLRVGVSRDLLQPPPDAAVQQAFDAAVRRLERLGATIVDLAMPHHDRILSAAAVVFGVEAEVHICHLIGDRPLEHSPRAAARRRPLPDDPTVWVRGQLDRQLVARDYRAAFTLADALLTPATPLAAPAIGADEDGFTFRTVPYTAAANLAGLPAVALPAGLGPDGLPIGVQVIAAPGRDDVALRIARTLEADAPEHRVQRPPQ